jgi:DegV family protein with EDD domain
MADSASDLPLNFFAENNVTMLPLKVHVKDQEFEDLLTINPETVYESIRNGDLPKTSQVSPAIFEKHFTELAKNNESGLYIAFSSELSGTYSTAVMIRFQMCFSRMWIGCQKGCKIPKRRCYKGASHPGC